ncbi:hypothetical protein EAO77_36115 [Streptomyces sp. t39]|nr:hypothetical protein EAO77_36115 [Streptomyces sp. t39]
MFQAPILTDGATHSAQQFRMLVRDLARGNEGITEGDDLKVTELDTPGGGVQISDGSGIVTGRVNAFQGSYSVANVGVDTVDVAANGGGATRYDMVILRVEDPEYEGTLDPAPGEDYINYFDVIPNVGSTATTIPGGLTGIPLARIAIPAATSVITDGMITDLRKVANPRRERRLYVQTPTSSSTAISGTSSTPTYFSTAAGWTIDVPEWATQAIISFSIGGLRLSSGDYYGNISATFGAALVVEPVIVDDDQGGGVRRPTHIMGDTLTIPDAYRGTSQLLRARGLAAAGNAGSMQIDASSTLIADVEFVEAPR